MNETDDSLPPPIHPPPPLPPVFGGVDWEGLVMKGALLGVLGAIGIGWAFPGCDGFEHPPLRETLHLPTRAVDVVDLGGGWHTFRLELAGRSRVFLRHAESRQESLIELAPGDVGPTGDDAVPPSLP